ncbi:hypothetical protein FDECE_14266 [Fusarium decemcellulare]|nr:hypothetical protein FDECE_14266 [Fusarium decemcellulare]
MSKAKEEFGINCHDGGTFYVCENNATEFIGCCASDPCGNSNGTCADEDLRRATFVKSIGQYVPAQDCHDSQGSDNWYTCASGNSFMGCCSQDPCGRDDCPAGRLVPAKLSSDDVLRHKFLFPDMSSLPNAASSATVSSSSKPDHNSAGLDTGTIAGIVVCAWVGCSLMAIIAMWLLWGKPRQKKQTNVGKSNKTSASSQPYDRLDDWHQDTLETQSPAGLNQRKRSCVLNTTGTALIRSRSSFGAVISLISLFQKHTIG